MKLKVIAHEAEEGGYWAEVPSIPRLCYSRSDIMMNYEIGSRHLIYIN
jgi:hypothetical protein